MIQFPQFSESVTRSHAEDHNSLQSNYLVCVLFVAVPSKINSMKPYDEDHRSLLQSNCFFFFEHLYNNKENYKKNEIYFDILHHKSILENETAVSDGNEFINSNISFDEVEHVVNNAKRNKVCGIDNIFNEILNITECKTVLYKLFNVCFASGRVPEQWLKAIITPVPKGSSKDPYMPLSYRGVSLLSHVGKAYSQLLNNCIIKYCNEVHLFCEEQNGFRKVRSCEDHIFTLISIKRNRFQVNKDLFVAFIDMQKAFDWVNRDLLWYKLLSINSVSYTVSKIKILSIYLFFDVFES